MRTELARYTGSTGKPSGNQLIEHLLRQARPRLELVDHDAFDFQAFVVVFLQFFDFRQQAIQRLARETVAIEGDQHTISSNQRRNRIKNSTLAGVSR